MSTPGHSQKMDSTSTLPGAAGSITTSPSARLCSVMTHTASHSTEEILLNPEFYANDFHAGELIQIYDPTTIPTERQQQKQKSHNRLILRIPPQPQTSSGRFELSILKTIADSVNLKQFNRVIVDHISEEDAALDFVELSFKKQYLPRGNMLRFKSALIGRTVHVNQTLTLNNMQAQSQDLRKNKDFSCYSGLITEKTKFVFRSKSARIIWLVQISAEMWDVDEKGEMYFEKFLKEFASPILDSWKSLGVSHMLTVIFFARTLHLDRISANTHPDLVHKKSFNYHDGYHQQDFFKIVIENIADIDKVTQLKKLRHEFWSFARNVGWKIPFQNCNGNNDNSGGGPLSGTGGKPNATASSSTSTAATGGSSATSAPSSATPLNTITCAVPSDAIHGNLLESINATLNILDKHYMDRDLQRTGNSIVMISAGSGVFKVKPTLSQITKQRMLDNAFGIDFISLSRPPVHAVPLFIVDCASSGAKDFYEIPHWIRVSYVDCKPSATLIQEGSENNELIPKPILAVASENEHWEYVWSKEFVPHPASSFLTSQIMHTDNLRTLMASYVAALPFALKKLLYHINGYYDPMSSSLSSNVIVPAGAASTGASSASSSRHVFPQAHGHGHGHGHSHGHHGHSHGHGHHHDTPHGQPSLSRAYSMKQQPSSSAALASPQKGSHPPTNSSLPPTPPSQSQAQALLQVASSDDTSATPPSLPPPPGFTAAPSTPIASSRTMSRATSHDENNVNPSSNPGSSKLSTTAPSPLSFNTPSRSPSPSIALTASTANATTGGATATTTSNPPVTSSLSINLALVAATSTVPSSTGQTNGIAATSATSVDELSISRHGPYSVMLPIDTSMTTIPDISMWGKAPCKELQSNDLITTTITRRALMNQSTKNTIYQHDIMSLKLAASTRLNSGTGIASATTGSSGSGGTVTTSNNSNTSSSGTNTTTSGASTAPGAGNSKLLAEVLESIPILRRDREDTMSSYGSIGSNLNEEGSSSVAGSIPTHGITGVGAGAGATGGGGGGGIDTNLSSSFLGRSYGSTYDGEGGSSFFQYVKGKHSDAGSEGNDPLTPPSASTGHSGSNPRGTAGITAGASALPTIQVEGNNTPLTNIHKVSLTNPSGQSTSNINYAYLMSLNAYENVLERKRLRDDLARGILFTPPADQSATLLRDRLKEMMSSHDHLVANGFGTRSSRSSGGNGNGSSAAAAAMAAAAAAAAANTTTTGNNGGLPSTIVGRVVSLHDANASYHSFDNLPTVVGGPPSKGTRVRLASGDSDIDSQSSQPQQRRPSQTAAAIQALQGESPLPTTGLPTSAGPTKTASTAIPAAPPTLVRQSSDGSNSGGSNKSTTSSGGGVASKAGPYGGQGSYPIASALKRGGQMSRFDPRYIAAAQAQAQAHAQAQAQQQQQPQHRVTILSPPPKSLEPVSHSLNKNDDRSSVESKRNHEDEKHDEATASALSTVNASDASSSSPSSALVPSSSAQQQQQQRKSRVTYRDFIARNQTVRPGLRQGPNGSIGGIHGSLLGHPNGKRNEPSQNFVIAHGKIIPVPIKDPNKKKAEEYLEYLQKYAEQYSINPFRIKEGEKYLNSVTHNRRRWSHVFPEGKHDRVVDYGLNWKSLTQPAILPLNTDYLPSIKDLEKNYSVLQYVISIDKYESPFVSVEAALKELICQRLSREFQLVENFDKASYMRLNKYELVNTNTNANSTSYISGGGSNVPSPSTVSPLLANTTKKSANTVGFTTSVGSSLLGGARGGGGGGGGSVGGVMTTHNLPATASTTTSSAVKAYDPLDNFYILTMGHRIHFLLGDVQNSAIRVTQYISKRSKNSEDEQQKAESTTTNNNINKTTTDVMDRTSVTYHYEMWLPQMNRFESMTQQFYQFPRPEFLWNKVDNIMMGDISYDGIDEGKKPRSLMYLIIPPDNLSTEKEIEDYYGKIDQFLEFMNRYAISKEKEDQMFLKKDYTLLPNNSPWDDEVFSKCRCSACVNVSCNGTVTIPKVSGNSHNNVSGSGNGMNSVSSVNVNLGSLSASNHGGGSAVPSTPMAIPIPSTPGTAGGGMNSVAVPTTPPPPATPLNVSNTQSSTTHQPTAGGTTSGTSSSSSSDNKTSSSYPPTPYHIYRQCNKQYSIFKCNMRGLPRHENPNWLYIKHDSVIYPFKAFHFFMHWFVCDSWLIDDFCNLLFRRCSKFGLRLSHIPGYFAQQHLNVHPFRPLPYIQVPVGNLVVTSKSGSSAANSTTSAAGVPAVAKASSVKALEGNSVLSANSTSPVTVAGTGLPVANEIAPVEIPLVHSTPMRVIERLFFCRKHGWIFDAERSTEWEEISFVPPDYATRDRDLLDDAIPATTKDTTTVASTSAVSGASSSSTSGLTSGFSASMKLTTSSIGSSITKSLQRITTGVTGGSSINKPDSATGDASHSASSSTIVATNQSVNFGRKGSNLDRQYTHHLGIATVRVAASGFLWFPCANAKVSDVTIPVEERTDMAMKILRHLESFSSMAVDCYEIVLNIVDHVFVEMERKEEAKEEEDAIGMMIDCCDTNSLDHVENSSTSNSNSVLLPLAAGGFEYRPQHSFIEKSPASGQNSALQFANNTTSSNDM